MRREQAIAATRRQLQAGMDQLQAQLQAQALNGVCEARLSLERQTAQVQCTDPADQARLSATLSAFMRVLPPDVAAAAETCLHIEGQTLGWPSCSAAQP